MTAPKQDAYARARQRQQDKSPDKFVRAVSRYAERGLDVCDCPCHWWPGVDEAVSCCRNRGMRWIGDGFVPWDQEEP